MVKDLPCASTRQRNGQRGPPVTRLRRRPVAVGPIRQVCRAPSEKHTANDMGCGAHVSDVSVAARWPRGPPGRFAVRPGAKHTAKPWAVGPSCQKASSPTVEIVKCLWGPPVSFVVRPDIKHTAKLSLPCLSLPCALCRVRRTAKAVPCVFEPLPCAFGTRQLSSFP